MSGLENLFAVEPTLPSVQKHKMPENSEKWAETLTTLIREMYPDAAMLPIVVEFRKRDDQSGTAVGALRITSVEANKSLFVPFVIERYQMHPLDVWMEVKTQKVHPLTKDTFKEQFFIQSVADGLDARPSDSAGQYFNDPSTWTSNYPPLQGRYSYASAGYTVLDQISDTMTDEDLKSFKLTLTENPLLLQKFARHGHEDLIKALIEKKAMPAELKCATNTNDFAQSVAALVPPTALDIRRGGSDLYSILMSVEGVYDLQGLELNRDSAKDFLSKIVGKPENVLNEVDINGEKMMILKPAPKDGVWLYDDIKEGAEDAKEFTCYWMKNKNGLLIDGLVIPHVVDFDGSKLAGKLVLSKTHSSYQPNVAGIKYPECQSFESVLKPSAVHAGQLGTFVYVGHNGQAVATLPMIVTAISGKYDKCIMGRDLKGRDVKIRLGYGNEFVDIKKNEAAIKAQDAKRSAEYALERAKNGIQPEQPKQQSAHDVGKKKLENMGFVELKKEDYMLPEHMVWVRMEPMTDLVSSSGEWMQKEAMSKGASANPLEVRWTGIVYDLRGSDMPNREMNERELTLNLVNYGASIEKVAQIIKKAKSVGRAKVHGCFPMKPMASIKKEAGEVYEKLASMTKLIRKNIIKEAAEVEDKTTVDTLLSLGFLNSENLSKFVSFAPVFEQAADLLAELTLASRLGLNEVPEAATVGAMTKLLDVVGSLGRIGASMKRPATKAT